jgi:hypothetical protein
MLCAVIELGLHGEAGHRVDATDVAVPLQQQGDEAASGERAPHPLTGTGRELPVLLAPAGRARAPPGQLGYRLVLQL